MNFELVLQLALQGFLMGGVYGLIALGLSLIFGVMRVINFAHGEMMVFAMFLTITFLFSWGIDISPKTSLALSSIRLGFLTVDVPRIIAFVLAILITLMVILFLKKTSIGKTIRAAADNRFGALIVGAHINRVYGFCFGIGAACVGAAGTLLVPLMPAKATMGAPYTLISFVIVILGGMGSLIGALVGGLIIGVAESLGTVFLPSSMKQVVSFSIMIIILLFRPQGLFGGKG